MFVSKKKVMSLSSPAMNWPLPAPTRLNRYSHKLYGMALKIWWTLQVHSRMP
ncbi:Uncharacterised protein [Salmonella enterica subsp. arizonae]|uniref:Uncharacterized protein n=1 Tax=Salmonella enterica subsp. arizonae TaxID=59203 RepID=A0A379T5U2_SALER|nr:Uncharacterised protein [Salmonella enterica subsp. arizonae]